MNVTTDVGAVAARALWTPRTAIDQLGYVVDDLAGALCYWTEVLGAGPFFCTWRDDPRPVTYRGEVTSITNSTALGYAGTTQIELIEQHCRTPSAYTEFLDAHGPGLHHVARFTTTYDADAATAGAAGMTLVMGGSAGSDIRYSYWEHASATRDAPLLELVSRGQNITATVDRLLAASRDWDGRTEPVRAATAVPSYAD